MPSKKVQVGFPLQGVDHTGPRGLQTPGTTRWATNVRGVDHMSQRSTGAQRAPLRPHAIEDATAPGTRSQCMAVVSYDATRTLHTQLNNILNPDVSPQDVIHGHLKSAGVSDASLRSLETDALGNLYAMGEDRLIHKFSPDGELLHTLPIQGYEEEEVVRRIQVDAAGNVYACSTCSWSSTLYRFEPHEDLGFTTRYRFKVDYQIRDFRLKFNQMYVAVRATTGGSYSAVKIFYGLDSGTGPWEIYERNVPHPVNGIAVSNAGELIVTCPRNLDRNASPDGGNFYSSVVSWTPHEIGYELDGAYNGFKRIHAWHDAKAMGEEQLLAEGDSIGIWPDRKQNGTVSSQDGVDRGPFTEVADTTLRPAYGINRPQIAYGWFFGVRRTYGWHLPPRYSGGGDWGQHPCIKFNASESFVGEDANFGLNSDVDPPWNTGATVEAGSALYWRNNFVPANRATETAENPDVRKLTAGNSASRTTFIVAKVSPGQVPRGLFASMSSAPTGDYGDDLSSPGFRGSLNFGIVLNCGGGAFSEGSATGDTDAPPFGPNDPGSVMLIGGQNRVSGSTSIIRGEYGGEDALADKDIYPRRFKGTDLPETNTVIIAVHHGQTLDSSHKSAFRVNGKHIDTFEFTSHAQSGHSHGNQFNPDNNVDTVNVDTEGYTEDTDDTAYNFATGCDVIGAATQRPTPHFLLDEAFETPWESVMDNGWLYGHGSTLETNIESAFNQRNTRDVFPFEGCVAEVLTVLGSGVAPEDGANYYVPDDHILIPDTDEPSEADPWWSVDGQETTEVEKIEGYLAHKWGIPHTLDPNHPYHPENRGCPISNEGEGAYDESGISDMQLALNSTDPILAKYDGQNGSLKWALSAPGVGLGVEVDSEGGIVTIGQPVTGDNENRDNPTTGVDEGNATVRKTLDLGATFSCGEVGSRKGWVLTDAQVPLSANTSPIPRIDANDDVYIPVLSDTEVRLGGDGVYKINGKDGVIEWHIPTPINYFMEGADVGLIGLPVSTGLGADDWSKLPWQVNYANSPEVVEYMEVRSNVAKHPITGEMTVATFFDKPGPMPNTTWTWGTDVGDRAVPKYRNLLYSADTEASEATSPGFNVIQHIDHFMPANELGTDEGWNGLGEGTSCRDQAFISAPDLTRPYSVSGKYGGPSLLSTESGESKRRETYGTGTNDRIKHNTTYCFSVWIQRNPLDAHTGGARSHNHARIDLKHNGSTYRNSYAVINLNTGELSTTHFSDNGGLDSTLGAATWGVESFTAAKDLGSTETAIWDRVFVTTRYDANWDSSADLGLSARIHPVCNANGVLGSDRVGAIHVWGPMLIEGTTPVAHNMPTWTNNMPYPSEVNQAWVSRVWLDGDADGVPQTAANRTGVHSTFLSHDTVTPKPLAVGDEVFFSCYIAKFADNQEPTAANPNPASVNNSYGGGNAAPWMTSYLKDKDGGNLEYFTWHVNLKTGDVFVRDFDDAEEGSGEQHSQVDPHPYGNAVVSEDAGDHWRIGCWLKYFGLAGSNTSDLFQFEVHNSGSGSLFVVGGRYFFSGAELYINSGVHPDAPGGLQFPTPTLQPHAPKAGGCLSVALPPESVEVDVAAVESTSEFTENQKQPETVAFTMNGNRITQDKSALRKHRVVAATPLFGEDQSTRKQQIISVSEGSLYEVNQEGSVDGYTLLAEGSGVLDSAAGQIRWVQHRSKLYLVDGNKVIEYDPKEGTVKELESKKEGEVPKRPQLVASWRNRLVLARTTEEPHNWHMSAVGDAENWNYFPVLPTATQAVAGNSSRAGQAPDIINALVPYNDDLMLIGGDHTISRMTGDPMAGGQIDLISQSIGMAFGDSWAMDPEGVVYFAGTEGAIYAMPPMGMPQEISNSFVRRNFLDKWDGSLFRIKLIWNHKDEGLHVLFLPGSTGFVDGGPGHDSYLAMRGLFWERRHNAWWQDDFHEDVTPYAAASSNGDQPNDRALLFGTREGKALRWGSGEDEANDNGQPVDSRIFIDVATPSMGFGSELKVLAAESRTETRTTGVDLYIHAADNPHQVDEPEARSEPIELGAREGTERIPVRVKGSCIGVSLRSAGVDGDWAFDELFLTLAPSSRRRLT